MHYSSIMFCHLLIVSLLIIGYFMCVECVVILLLELILTMLDLLDEFCHVVILTEQQLIGNALRLLLIH